MWSMKKRMLEFVQVHQEQANDKAELREEQQAVKTAVFLLRNYLI